jgi:hypothetical protein
MGVGGASAEDAEADFMHGVCENELVAVSPLRPTTVRVLACFSWLLS